jgi:hypothetical protein
MPWLRRVGPALGLFLLVPFVGEFLLGNLTVGELGLVLVLAPLYGFGALLVRELGRRSGGWPTMVLLAAAYALIEEGPVDQLLWNDSYAGHDYLHGDSYLPALGMSVELTQTILALHTVWPHALRRGTCPHGTQAARSEALAPSGLDHALLLRSASVRRDRFPQPPASVSGEHGRIERPGLPAPGYGLIGSAAC